MASPARKLKGWTRQSMREIEGYLGATPAKPPPTKPAKSPGQRLAVGALLAACQAPWVVSQHLADRGIRDSPVLPAMTPARSSTRTRPS